MINFVNPENMRWFVVCIKIKLDILDLSNSPLVSYMRLIIDWKEEKTD
jgi:hypothetical protein